MSTAASTVIQIPMATAIGIAMDRFQRLAEPPLAPNREREPSPMAAGGTPLEWARQGGLMGELPHELIRDLYPKPFDLGSHDVETVAHAALGRLAHLAKVERFGGLPVRYRPLVR